MRSAVLFLALPCFLATSAMAQLPVIGFSGGMGGGPDGIKGTATFNLSHRSVQLVPNAAYSGEPKHETSQTLPDGTHVNRTLPGPNVKVWRDSQGRVRMQQSLGPANRANYPTLVQIEDPVAGYIYVMDDITKVVHRIKVAVVPQRNMDPMELRVAVAGAAPAANQLPRPQMSGPEDLGTQMIDGVSVRGSRTTTVFPAGFDGNDGPITTTRDTWYSPDLKLVIQTVSNDPRSGTQTTGVANLSRIEPDPALFLLPADYTIVDETGSFTIKWGEK